MAIKISSILQLQQVQGTFLKAWGSVFPLLYVSYSPVLSGYCGKKKGKLQVTYCKLKITVAESTMNSYKSMQCYVIAT